MAPTLVLRRDKLDALAELSELSGNEIARRGGLDQAHYRRVVRGDVNPGPRFIAALIVVFGAESLPALLTVTNGDTP